MARHRQHLSALASSIHCREAVVRVTPLGHVLGDIQRFATGMRLAQRLLTLRCPQGQDPIAYTQLDIAIGLGLESRPPIGMLVVVVGMRRMSVKIDEHGPVPLR